jgi:hypothetical protein
MPSRLRMESLLGSSVAHSSIPEALAAESPSLLAPGSFNEAIVSVEVLEEGDEGV